MFPYSDSDIQYSLDSLGRRVSSTQRRNLVAKLNSGDMKRASASMWEVMVASQFLNKWFFGFETANNGKYPDLTFGWPKSRRVLIDVKSISDAGIHDKNPIVKLNSYIIDFMLKHPGKLRYLSVDVRANESGQLALPEDSKIERFFLDSIKPILLDIAENPTMRFKHLICDDYTHVELNNDPKRQAHVFSHPVFDQPKKFPNAIKTQLSKAKKQLRATEAGCKCVVICNAGSNFFSGEDAFQRISDMMDRGLDEHSDIHGIVAVSPFVQWDRFQRRISENRVYWKANRNSGEFARVQVARVGKALKGGLPLPKFGADIRIQNRYNRFGERFRFT